MWASRLTPSDSPARLQFVAVMVWLGWFEPKAATWAVLLRILSVSSLIDFDMSPSR
jgi:hypothetical protein